MHAQTSRTFAPIAVRAIREYQPERPTSCSRLITQEDVNLVYQAAVEGEETLGPILVS